MNIGNKSMPNTHLSTAIELTRSFYAQFGFEEIDPDIAARHFGYSNATNGAYRAKLADLRSYSLFTPRGKPQISTIGKQATFPDNEEERINASLEALKSVDIYKLLYEKYKDQPPNDIWADLAKWTDAKPNEAQAIQQKVRDAYLSDIRKINLDKITFQQTAIDKEESKTHAKQSHNSESEIETVSDASAKLITKYGTVYIIDPDTIAIAQSYLAILEKSFREKSSAKQKDEA